jgi:hypothetical protein
VLLEQRPGQAETDFDHGLGDAFGFGPLRATRRLGTTFPLESTMFERNRQRKTRGMADDS